jgi:hypothetical protein
LKFHHRRATSSANVSCSATSQRPSQVSAHRRTLVRFRSGREHGACRGQIEQWRDSAAEAVFRARDACAEPCRWRARAPVRHDCPLAVDDVGDGPDWLFFRLLEYWQVAGNDAEAAAAQCVDEGRLVEWMRSGVSGLGRRPARRPPVAGAAAASEADRARSLMRSRAEGSERRVAGPSAPCLHHRPGRRPEGIRYLLGCPARGELEHPDRLVGVRSEANHAERRCQLGATRLPELPSARRRPRAASEAGPPSMQGKRRSGHRTSRSELILRTAEPMWSRIWTCCGSSCRFASPRLRAPRRSPRPARPNSSERQAEPLPGRFEKHEATGLDRSGFRPMRAHIEALDRGPVLLGRRAEGAYTRRSAEMMAIRAALRKRITGGSAAVRTAIGVLSAANSRPELAVPRHRAPRSPTPPRESRQPTGDRDDLQASDPT